MCLACLTTSSSFFHVPYTCHPISPLLCLSNITLRDGHGGLRHYSSFTDSFLPLAMKTYHPFLHCATPFTLMMRHFAMRFRPPSSRQRHRRGMASARAAICPLLPCGCRFYSSCPSFFLIIYHALPHAYYLLRSLPLQCLFSLRPPSRRGHHHVDHARVSPGFSRRQWLGGLARHCSAYLIAAPCVCVRVRVGCGRCVCVWGKASF